MNIRKILVPLDGSRRDAGALQAAFAIATGFEAHVAAMHVPIATADALPFVGEGMSAGLVQEMMEISARESATRAAAAYDAFERLRQEAGVPLASAPPGPCAVWLRESGPRDDALAAAGRLADLVVFARPEASHAGGGHGALGTALFETGRPVLIAGTGDAQPLGGDVIVAWDNSAQAAHALAAALPFLVSAGKVTVLTAGSVAETAKSPAAVVDYLAWHGISAQWSTVAPEPSVGEALAAAVAGADLLVMGGYSHSRLREMILGGVTRHMLERAGLPLLLAH